MHNDRKRQERHDEIARAKEVKEEIIMRDRDLQLQERWESISLKYVS